MIFNVVKATEHFSKSCDKAGRHALKFEVVPDGPEQLDIGEKYVLLGTGYHAFKATDRALVLATVTVSADPEISGKVKGNNGACGSIHFFKEMDHDFTPAPAELAMYVAVDPEIFEAIAQAKIEGPGAATITLRVEGLGYGWAPDGSHKTWEMEKTMSGERAELPITDFHFSVERFWTTEQAIRNEADRKLHLEMAESPNEKDREHAATMMAASPDPTTALLLQCRKLLSHSRTLLLVLVLILAVLTFGRP